MAEYRDDLTGQEQDDPPEVADVELCVAACLLCCNGFATPASEPERFCSMVCENRWCKRQQAYSGPTTDDGDAEIPF